MNPHTPSPAPSSTEYHGTIVYLTAFDLAYDMRRTEFTTLLGQPVELYSLHPSKRRPRTQFFYQPQMITLQPSKSIAPQSAESIKIRIKVFNVGAISIQTQVQFNVTHLEELVAYHDMAPELSQHINELAESIRKELAPHCIRPVDSLTESEAYTVFCLDTLPAPANVQTTIKAQEWLTQHGRLVAGLLTQEEDPSHISQQEIEESTGRYLSYYDRDLVVIDWDAALVAGESDSIDDILHVMELANVQLIELSAYDQLLDTGLQNAYRDLSSRRGKGIRSEVTREIRSIQVDLARLSDELSNITKFFGDWHLARVYGLLAERFHLGDWHRVIDEKLKTLADLYGLLQQDRINLWMVVLEATIVLLFILDVLLFLWHG